MLVPCTVESVRVHVLTNQHVVLLQAEGTKRLLPIWIGPDQAHSIATRIAGIASERPLTHDLMVDMLTKMGAEITRVVVKDLVADDAGGGVFHGSVFLQVADREIEVDCRPSAAMAALRSRERISSSSRTAMGRRSTSTTPRRYARASADMSMRSFRTGPC